MASYVIGIFSSDDQLKQATQAAQTGGYTARTATAQDVPSFDRYQQQGSSLLLVETKGRESEVRMLLTKAGATGFADQAATADQDLRVPLREEELLVGKQRQEEGRVRLHKTVAEEQQTVTVPLEHEEVTVERVSIHQPTTGEDMEDAFIEGDIEIKLEGESAVVEKRVNTVEEVRLHEKTVTKNQQVAGTVRKERLEVDGVDQSGHAPVTDQTTQVSTEQVQGSTRAMSGSEEIRVNKN